ncbi:MAG TPA: hypothetical protein VHM20_03700 [Gammaproteobacteria bacterium]|jgi:hypothetical protein|nr:hypothetical protein [Gammaproteobacteria bacterium]
MEIKKILTMVIVVLNLFFQNISSFALNSLAQTQTLQIYTHFHNFVGKPTWLLIVRDVETGLVSPYIFDIRNNDNFWVAFTFGHHYKVTTSKVTFGQFAVINNFCGLENGILSGISMYMKLTGSLTPDPKTTKCHVTKYQNSQFTIVNEN